LQAVEHAGQDAHKSFEEMARHYADEIIREHPSGRCDLLGYSLGGMVAYATACELARRGREVGTLSVIDSMPSNLPRAVQFRVLAHYRHFIRWFKKHAKTLTRTPPRLWPDFLRARSQGFYGKLQRDRARSNRAISGRTRQNSDYYQLIGDRFVPQPCALDTRLFISIHNEYNVREAWRYLVGGRLATMDLECRHLDVFSPEHLEKFTAAFLRFS
jgi:thioesterase domain-containing protein